MDDLSRCLGWFSDKYGVPVVLRQTTVEQQYEGFALLSILGAILDSGYSSTHALDFCSYATLPRRDVTDGRRRDRALRPESLVTAFVPQATLRRENKAISVYYQGYPLIPSDLRPDITLLKGEVSTSVVDVFGGKAVSVSFRQDSLHAWSNVRLVDLVAGPQGPVEHYQSRKILVNPDLLVEVTTSKSPGRTRSQFSDYIAAFRPKHVGFLHQQSFSPRSVQGLLFSFQGVRPDIKALGLVIESIGQGIRKAEIV